MKSSITLSVLILLALTACGKLDSGLPVTVDSAFRSQVDYFLEAAAVRGHGDLSKEIPPIVFGELDVAEDGRCEKDFLGGRRIIISRDRWGMHSDWEKSGIILHELGHCVLNRKHEPSEQSLMFSDVARLSIRFSENESTYLDELFSAR